MMLGLFPMLVVAGEQQDSSTIRVSGSAGLTFDAYAMNSYGIQAALPRRPSTVLRLFASPVIAVSDWLEIPIEISLTSREASLIQPSLNAPEVFEILTNPMNRFSISPHIGPVQIHLGSVVPRYGSLVVDNAQVFGIGVDVNPGALRLSATYGILSRSVAVDTFQGKRGSYSRTLAAFRLGSEINSDSRFGFTFARMSDDPGSIPFITEDQTIAIPMLNDSGVSARDSTFSFVSKSTLLPLAQEGLSCGFDMHTPIAAGIYLGAEVAGTAFTRDRSAPEVVEKVPILSSLNTVRTSTRIDYAGKFVTGYTSNEWGVEGGISYIGPGYVCLTQPYLQPDRIDVTITPKATIAQGTFMGSATIGWRRTGILSMLTTGSTQLLITVNAATTIAQTLVINAGFTNFGYRTTVQSDTLRYEQISQSVNFSPNYTLNRSLYRHQFGSSLNWDTFRDETRSGVPSKTNTTLSVAVFYGILPVRGNWSARASVTHMTNNLEFGGVSATSGTISGSYRILDGLLMPDGTIVYSSNSFSGQPTEQQITLRLGVRIRVSNALSGFARHQLTSISSASETGRDYSENLGSMGITYSF